MQTDFKNDLDTASYCIYYLIRTNFRAAKEKIFRVY